MKRIAKPLLIACGTLCVLLAVFGIVLPLLPTTPFLLLAAFCYARSSQRFYDRLMGNRWFGAYLRNYREGRGIPLRQKLSSLALLWLTIGYAAGFVVAPLWGKLLLLAIAAAVTWHLITVGTGRPEGPAAMGDGDPTGEESPLAKEWPANPCRRGEPPPYRHAGKE